MKRAPEKLLKALLEAEKLQAANKSNKAVQAARHAYRLALDYLPVGHPERQARAEDLPFEEWVHEQLRKTREAAEEIGRRRGVA